MAARSEATGFKIRDSCVTSETDAAAPRIAPLKYGKLGAALQINSLDAQREACEAFSLHHRVLRSATFESSSGATQRPAEDYDLDNVQKCFLGIKRKDSQPIKRNQASDACPIKGGADGRSGKTERERAGLPSLPHLAANAIAASELMIRQHTKFDK